PDRSLSCLCLPHVRGGVSAAGWPEMRSCASSPRPWGCFPRTRAALYPHHVFPTSVGVFPDAREVPRSGDRLPHVRGGVSHVPGSAAAPDASSPRPWGCFREASSIENRLSVFPTSVGVFP